MIMDANKQRSALVNMLVEAMMTGVIMLIVLIGDVCSGVVVACEVQTTALITKAVY